MWEERGWCGGVLGWWEEVGGWKGVGGGEWGRGVLEVVFLWMFSRLCRRKVPVLGRWNRLLSSASPPGASPILIADQLDPRAATLLSTLGHTPLEPPHASVAEVLAAHPVEAIIVRSATQITAELLESAPASLKVIARAGTGVDNIDIPAATRKGIVVMNTPGANTVSTAELTLSMLLSLARRIPAADASLKRGEWARGSLSGRQVAGKTLGVVGLGRIGREVATRAQAFGMEVVGFDPLLTADVAEEELGVRLLSLEELFAEADVLTLHTPQTAETAKLINADSLSRCKDGVWVVNCARGGLVDEEALLAALESGKVGGAALDVFSQEPPQGVAEVLARHPRVVATPHLGASTAEAQETVALGIAQQVSDALLRHQFRGVVNAKPPTSAPALAPFLSIAHRTGSLAAQLLPAGAPAPELTVTVAGARAKDRAAAAAVSSAVLQGFLQALLREEEVNFINAPLLAADRGIHIQDRVEPQTHEFENLLSLEIPNLGLKLAGTFFGGEPRLVRVGDARVDIRPRGPMLLIRNQDTSGVLFSVTDVLARDSVNIADVSLARTTDHAISILALDSQPSQTAVDAIRALPTIHSAHVLTCAPDDPPPSTPSTASAADTPTTKPQNPQFGSGPTKKRPGWALEGLVGAATGRSHRSDVGKGKLKEAIDRTRDILGVPASHRIALMPGSDTGAFEAAMWSLLHPERGVDVLHFESFGTGWYKTITKHLRHPDVRSFESPYGRLPDVSGVDFDRDVVFPYNGTTSGVCFSPATLALPAERAGLVLCDATSAVFSQHVPIGDTDALTFSFQKALGGEGGIGVLVLSPAAAERAEANATNPPFPLPKLFRLTDGNGALNEALFQGATINTPSLLVVEDYLDALRWAERSGGVDGLTKRANENLAVVQDFVDQHDWIQNLATDPATRSNTSVCLSLPRLGAAQIKRLTTLLAQHDAALDIGGYRDAPPSLRVWCGATVEKDDLAALMQWIHWAYDQVKHET